MILCALLVTCTKSYAEGRLVLKYRCHSQEVLERCPLAAILTVANVGDSRLLTIFSEREPDIIGRDAIAVLQDREGKTYVLRHRGGPIREYPAPIADQPMEAGEQRTAERLFSLIVWTPPPPHWAGTTDERYKFLKPGVYTGYVEVPLLHGEKLVSDEFELKILEAKGVDALARDLIQFRHVGFLEGRDVPNDESVYRGGRSRHGADRTRYREIQEILEKYPGSTYAEWIRFWKLYQYAPQDEALQWARTHRDFPLSDNLMLRVAKRLFHQAGKHDQATFNRVRELIAELQRDFPDGDTRAQVLTLQEKLTKKP